MVILDNETRWNSTYKSITRACELYHPIMLFCMDHDKELEDDYLSQEEWAQIRDLKVALEPFERLTVELQSRATEGHHGSVWETLPAIESLLEHLEELKTKLPEGDSQLQDSECSPLGISINNAWAVLDKYYRLTDDNYKVYANATLLHPAQRGAYFERQWTGPMASDICVMKQACLLHWKDEYLPRLQQFSNEATKISFLDKFLYKNQAPNTTRSEFEAYYRGDPIQLDTSEGFNVF